MEEDDQTLIDRAAAGDIRAFEILYRRYREFVYKVARRLVHDDATAMDVSQETFTYLIRKIPSLHLTGRLSTYLYPAVKNIAVTHLRKRRRHVAAAPMDLRSAMDVRAGDSGGLDRDLGLAIDSLPEGQREVLLMRIVDEMSVDEVASALSIPPGTVKSRLHMAIASLRDHPVIRRIAPVS